MPKEKIIGSATVGAPDAGSTEQVTIVIDGPCVEETLLAMERGDRGKPMSRSALETIRTQASQVLESIVDAYTTNVASGEVGSTGRAKASTLAPRSGPCPTGLLYGRVQSGKTAAMIVTSALAIDNGFRVLVVLTS